MLHLKKLIPGLLLCLPFTSHAVKTILCGHLQKKSDNAVSLQYYANPIDEIESVHTTVYADVDAKNNFKLVINIDHPTMVNARNGDSWLFINKFINSGDSLHFDFDSTSTNIEGIGENGIGGMFMYDATIQTGKNISDRQTSFGTKTDVEFAKFWDGQTDTGLAFYNNYYATSPAPEPYVAAVKAELRYDAMVNMVQFGWRGKKGNDSMFDKPEYMKYFGKYAFNDSAALVSDYYIFFLGQFTRYMLQPTSSRSAKKIEFYQRFRLRDSVARKYFTGKVYDIALYHILHDAVQNLESTMGSATFDSNYIKTTAVINSLGGNFNDRALLPRLKDKMKILAETGKPAYDFSAKTLDGKTAHLSDYKGRVVYVDFWSTSCVPCVSELPHIKQLQEKYKDRNDIVFLYVSFDNSVDLLKRFIKERDFKGTHLVDVKGFASDAAIHYHISGIPRHIIVDKKGAIVSTNAPRPSEAPERILDRVLERKD